MEGLDKIIEEIDFANELAETRHVKLIAKLGDLAALLNKPAIEVKEVDLTRLETLIVKLKPEPVDNSELKGIVKSVDFTLNLISNMIEQIKNKKQPSKLQVVRTSEGVIDFVNIEYNIN